MSSEQRRVSSFLISLYGHLRKYLDEVFRDLALQKEGRILEGYLVGDHVRMLISIPPTYPV